MLKLLLGWAMLAFSPFALLAGLSSHNQTPLVLGFGMIVCGAMWLSDPLGEKKKTAAADHKVDRAGWPEGPWDNEADYLHWVDEPTNLDCLIVRAGLGHLCGYVGVPEGHPWHGVDYLHLAVLGEGHSVHGSLTYSARCGGSVCHDVKGRPEPVWWLGFDCGHSGDYAPGMDGRRWPTGPDSGSYRNVQYVQDQISALRKAVTAAKKVA